MNLDAIRLKLVEKLVPDGFREDVIKNAEQYVIDSDREATMGEDILIGSFLLIGLCLITLVKTFFYGNPTDFLLLGIFALFLTTWPFFMYYYYIGWRRKSQMSVKKVEGSI